MGLSKYPPPRGKHPSSSKRGRNWLFIIAIVDYEFETPLNNCVYDAQTLRDILLERYTFDKENVIELYDKDATRSNIYKEFEELVDGKVQEEDNLVIYYSGHGVMDKTREFCWVPVEGSEEDRSAFLGILKIMAFLDNINVRHIFLIVDSCFSGNTTNSPEVLSTLNEELETLRSRQALTSGRHELVSDGEPGEHSPFARSIIEVLKKSKVSISGRGLSAQVMDYVVNEFKVTQTPKFEQFGKNQSSGGDIIFHLKESLKSKYKLEVGGQLEPDILSHIPIREDIGYPKVPFKGLQWFEEKDARVFFGRKNEILDLYQLINNKHDKRKRLILLYGPSGVGKSSLLFAGLLPRLPEKWSVEYKRRGLDGKTLDIMDSFSPINLENSVLIIDQLEEIFSNPGKFGDQEKKNFRIALDAMLQRLPDSTVILSFREEYLARIQDMIGLPSDYYTSRIINYLDMSGILEALTGAASTPINEHYQNLQYKGKELPKTIALHFQDLGAYSYTPLIQYLLHQMYEELIDTQNVNDLVFTENLYLEKRRDSISELLNTQLEKVSHNYEEEYRNGLLIDLLFFFVTDDITSDSHSLSHILETYNHISDIVISGICEAFKNYHLLLTINDATRESSYRLTHDLLAKQINKRYNESAAFGQQANRYLESAMNTDMPLPEKAMLVIEKGQYGRKKFSDQEKLILINGWEQHIRALVIKSIQDNEIDHCFKLIKIYAKWTYDIEAEKQEILFQSRYNALHQDNIKGVIKYTEYLNALDEFKREVVNYFNQKEFDKIAHQLTEILKCVIRKGDIEGVYGVIESFSQNPIQNISTSIREILGRFQSLKRAEHTGLFDEDEFIIYYSSCLSSFIDSIWENYLFNNETKKSILSEVDLTKTILEILDDVEKQIISFKKGSYYFYSENSKEEIRPSPLYSKNQILNSLLDNLKYVVKSLSTDKNNKNDTIDLCGKLIHILAMFNWMAKKLIWDLLDPRVILLCFSRMSYGLERINNNLKNTSLRQAQSLKEPQFSKKSAFDMFGRLYSDDIESALKFMVQDDTISSKYSLDLKKVVKKINQKKIDFGLLKCSFDDYRTSINQSLDTIIFIITDAYKIDPIKEKNGDPIDILFSIQSGKLWTSPGPFENFVKYQSNSSLTEIIVWGAIAHEIEQMLIKCRISYRDYVLWRNKLIDLLLEIFQEYIFKSVPIFWTEDKLLDINLNTVDYQKEGERIGNMPLQAIEYLQKMLYDPKYEYKIIKLFHLRARLIGAMMDADNGYSLQHESKIEIRRIKAQLLSILVGTMNDSKGGADKKVSKFELMDLVAKANLGQAISLLRNFLKKSEDSKYYTDSILIENRFNSLEDTRTKGTIRDWEYKIERAKIVNSLIQLILIVFEGESEEYS